MPRGAAVHPVNANHQCKVILSKNMNIPTINMSLFKIVLDNDNEGNLSVDKGHIMNTKTMMHLWMAASPLMSFAKTR